MCDFPILPNAPIAEAVLDIKAIVPDGVDLKTFEEFHDKIKNRFAERKTRRLVKVMFELSDKGSVPASTAPENGPDGYLFRSPKENKIVQTRLDGFTFNKLRPYENWDVFRSEAHKLWELFCKITKTSRVEKIALRYINRIEIPMPLGDFGEYILTNPQIAPGLPQALSHFLMRMEIPNDEIQAIAIITQTMERPTKLQKLPLIFDIDVQKTANYAGNMSKMWDDFDKLRHFKNDIFFTSITEKTVELFK